MGSDLRWLTMLNAAKVKVKIKVVVLSEIYNFAINNVLLEIVYSQIYNIIFPICTRIHQLYSHMYCVAQLVWNLKITWTLRSSVWIIEAHIFCFMSPITPRWSRTGSNGGDARFRPCGNVALYLVPRISLDDSACTHAAHCPCYRGRLHPWQPCRRCLAALASRTDAAHLELHHSASPYNIGSTQDWDRCHPPR
jgi:hypothetical protein